MKRHKDDQPRLPVETAIRADPHPKDDCPPRHGCDDPRGLKAIGPNAPQWLQARQTEQAATRPKSGLGLNRPERRRNPRPAAKQAPP